MHAARILVLFAVAFAFSGCVAARQSHPSIVTANPAIVPGNNSEVFWERLVSVVNDYYFPVARENRLNGIIETGYKTGAGILEPWHPDAVGLENRLEGTFQSVRRRAVITVRPRPSGGYLVGVEVLKELENLAGLAAGSPGGATFQDSRPLQRDLTAVVGQSAPSGWSSKGRDVALEQHMLARIRAEFSG